MRLDATRVRDIMSPVMAVPNLMSDDSPEVSPPRSGFASDVFSFEDEATEKVLGLVVFRICGSGRIAQNLLRCSPWHGRPWWFLSIVMP